MLKYEFKINNKIFYITLLNLIKDNEINNKKLNKLYIPCFNNPNTIKNILNFQKNISFLIIDENDNFIFLCTFIKNIKTKSIELYNVCKNLNCKYINASSILINIIKFFIINNINYKGYKRINLAILLDNEYIIPTIFCYQNIGFRYSKNISLSTYLPKHFTMTLNLKKNLNISNNLKYNDFIKIINNHFNTIDKLNNIYIKLIPTEKQINHNYKIEIINYLKQIFNYEKEISLIY